MKNLEKPMLKNKQVFTTKDYSMFKTKIGNRQLNELHKRRLLDSISEVLLFTVIIVNELYEIIDGQHRFECLKTLGLPVNYVICEGYGLNEVHILNQNSKTWTSDDYVKGYSELGIEDYKIYGEFKERYGYGHQECMCMLSGMQKNIGPIFRSGEFRIANYREACKNAELIETIKPYYDGYKRRAFIHAMLQLFKKPQFSFAEFIKKLSQQSVKLVDCTTSKQYLTLIEEIYNHYRRQEDKVNLRF